MPRSLLLVLVAVLLAAGDDYRKDIVYGRAGDVDLLLDLALPADRSRPVPAIVCIHGGGFIEGNRRQFAAVARAFAREGFVAASIDYRLAPRFPLPAQIQDAKAAVRYLRANATALGIDPARIGAVGGSAGGQLALMLGLSGADPLLEGEGGNPGVDSRVQAVVNLAGTTDMTPEAWVGHERAVKTVYKGLSTEMAMAILFGAAPAPGLIALCSPISHAGPGDPPVLTMHGDKDTTVPVQQAQRLHARLDEAKVVNQLVIREGIGHNVASGAVKGVTGAAIAFFKQHLAAGP